MSSSNNVFAALISESEGRVKGLLQEFAGLSDFLARLQIAFGNEL